MWEEKKGAKDKFWNELFDEVSYVAVSAKVILAGDLYVRKDEDCGGDGAVHGICSFILKTVKGKEFLNLQLH